jgi:hypothetical protein
MKIRELIKQLETYNQEAKVDVIAHNQRCDFTITYGGDGEGVTKNNTTSVSVYVDSLNNNETLKTK